MIRISLAAYAALLRLMPPGFRREFGAEAVADLGEILEEARKYEGQTVIGTALRACLDLLVRLPGA